jgi:hypothetical protein
MSDPALGYIVSNVRTCKSESGKPYFSFTVELPELNLVFSSEDHERILGLQYSISIIDPVLVIQPCR